MIVWNLFAFHVLPGCLLELTTQIAFLTLGIVTQELMVTIPSGNAILATIQPFLIYITENAFLILQNASQELMQMKKLCNAQFVHMEQGIARKE